jgi:hypothetical protein
MSDDQILLMADTEIHGSYIVREVTNAELIAFARAIEKRTMWQGLTDEDVVDLQKASWVDKQAFEAVAWMIDEFLEKKNT